MFCETFTNSYLKMEDFDFPYKTSHTTCIWSLLSLFKRLKSCIGRKMPKALPSKCHQ